MSDLTTQSVGRAARSESLRPAEAAKSDPKTEALKTRLATIDAGALSRLTRQEARSAGNTQGLNQILNQSLATRGVHIEQGAAARAKEPQHANSNFAKSGIDEGYSVLGHKGQGISAKGKGVSSAAEDPYLKPQANAGSRGTFRAAEDPYLKPRATASSRGTFRAAEDPYLKPRATAGSRSTFRPLADRQASIGSTPEARLTRLKAAVQKLFAAIKSLTSRVAQLKSRPESELPRGTLTRSPENWRNPDLARRPLPAAPNQGGKVIESGYEFLQRVPTNYERAGQGKSIPAGYEQQGVGQGGKTEQKMVSVELSATQKNEERLRTDMRNLGDAQKTDVRRLSDEIDKIALKSKILDKPPTDAEALQVAQNRHDIALIFENYTKEPAGGGKA